MRRAQTFTLLMVAALLLAAVGVPAGAHPDPPGAKDNHVQLYLDKITLTPDPSDGWPVGDAEMYMFTQINHVHHGEGLLQIIDEDVVGGTWRPSPGQPVYTHNECSPREDIILTGFFLELDAGLDNNIITNVTSGLIGGAAGLQYAGLKGAAVGFVVGTLASILFGLNDNDDYGRFNKTLPGPGKNPGVTEFEFDSESATEGGDGTASMKWSVSEVERGRVICLSPITATFENKTTTYTAKVSSTENFKLKWTKTGNDCGTFTVLPPRLHSTSAAWNHPHPPCHDEPAHEATITLTMSAPDYVCTATYPNGSSVGTGPAPTCQEILPSSINPYLPAGSSAVLAADTPESLTSKTFNPLAKALEGAPTIKPESGNPAGLTRAAVNNTRDTYTALAIGLAKVLAGMAIEVARGHTGAQAAIDSFLSAQQQHDAGDLPAALDGYRSAYQSALAAATAATGDPNARLPLQVIVAPDFLGTRVGKTATLLGTVVGYDGPVNVTLAGAPEGVAATIDTVPNDPTIFSIELDLSDAKPGSFVLTVSAMNGQQTVTQDVQVEVSPPQPSCKGETATIVGTSGDDTLKGTDRDDVIAALDGDDVIKSGSGNDIVCGGDGKDSIDGGAGNDKLYGEGDGDRLVGGSGKDLCDGGPGPNKITRSGASACEKT